MGVSRGDFRSFTHTHTHTRARARARSNPPKFFINYYILRGSR